MSACGFSTHSRIGAPRQVRDPRSPKHRVEALSIVFMGVFMGPGMRYAHPGMSVEALERQSQAQP